MFRTAFEIFQSAGLFVQCVYFVWHEDARINL